MRTALLMALLIASFSAFAERFLDLKMAYSLALERNIELAKYPFQIQQQGAMAIQADIMPSPEIALEVADLIGTNQYGLFEQTEISLLFSQTIEMGKKRQLRLAHSSAAEDSLRLEYELTKIDILAETSRRYYQLLKLQAMQQVVFDKIEQEKRTLVKIKKLITAGAVGIIDKTVVSLRLKRSQAQRLKLKSLKKIAQNRLASMWQGNVDFDSVKGSIFTVSNLPSLTSLTTSLAESPAILHLLSLQREADQNLSLLKENAQANITYSAGLTHKRADSSQTLSFGVSMPLNYTNPNKGRIEQANFVLQETELLAEESKRNLELILKEHWLRMQQHQQQVSALKNEILPEAKKLLNESIKSYNRGNSSILQLVDAQQQWLDLKVDLIEASHAIYMQQLELERLTSKKL